MRGETSLTTSRRYAVLSALAIAAACAIGDASASGIPFGGNRPSSFAFYDVKPGESYNTVGQYVQFNNDDRAFNANGDEVKGSGTHTFVGLTQPLHRGKTQSGLNWLITGVLPVVRVQGAGVVFSGIADPLVGGGMFLNPNPATNVGFLALVQAPIGDRSVTTDTWSFWPSLFYDSWFGRLGIAAHAGFILRQTTHQSGANDLDPGNTFHMNLRVAYSLRDLTWKDSWYAIPYMALDYQKTGRTTDSVTGANVPITGQVPGPDTRETAMGLGILLQLQKTKFYDQLTAHYSKGLSGRNTALTDGLFMQYFHYW